jgi:hypothetical protein
MSSRFHFVAKALGLAPRGYGGNPIFDPVVVLSPHHPRWKWKWLISGPTLQFREESQMRANVGRIWLIRVEPDMRRLIVRVSTPVICVPRQKRDHELQTAGKHEGPKVVVTETKTLLLRVVRLADDFDECRSRQATSQCRLASDERIVTR